MKNELLFLHRIHKISDESDYNYFVMFSCTSVYLEWITSDITSITASKVTINVAQQLGLVYLCMVLARGIYSLALKQQSAKDHDCALYKYFLRPANANQHLNYWMDYIGNVSDQVAFFTYCIKVY